MALVEREVYTFIDGVTGENTHIDAIALRAWCLAHPELEVVNTPVDPEIAKRFITHDNSISIDNLKRVAAMKHHDPLIYCKTGSQTNGAPDVMLVDGHHRYFICAVKEIEWAPAYVLEREQWQPFVLDWVPKMTEEELRAAPKKRAA